jgi:hypothetical protein
MMLQAEMLPSSRNFRVTTDRCASTAARALASRDLRSQGFIGLLAQQFSQHFSNQSSEKAAVFKSNQRALYHMEPAGQAV